MDLFCDISYKNIASQIKENEYTESNLNKKEIKKEEIDSQTSLFESILSKNDIEYENSDNKKMYIEQIKIEIASKLDEDSSNYYDCFKYKKTFSKRLIQTGFLKYNSLSSVLYMIDYYKINIIIYDKILDKYICLSTKYDKYDIYEYDRKWKHIDSISDTNKISYEYYDKQHEYMNYDIKSIYIYQTDMKSISDYNTKELSELAKSNNINIIVNGSKLKKKEIYNILYYNII
tara:strand:- start:7929 stop:8624 length:696 start_codon:yes stop_codon:yes gene_type:complete